MRKLFLSIFGMIIFAAALCMSVSAEPAVSGGDSADPGHVHITEWQTDEEYHREVCTVCGETVSEGAHEFSEESGCACTVCGNIVHQYGESGYTAAVHYDRCSRCGQTYNEKPHTFEKNLFDSNRPNYDGHYRKCDDCDYVAAREKHTGKLLPSDVDNTNHYYICEDCGYLLKTRSLITSILHQINTRCTIAFQILR